MRQMKFGIELEVATKKSISEMIDALTDAGIKASSSYYGSPVESSTWKVQPDGSINGWEIVSPPLADTEELQTVVHVLRKVLKVRSSIKTGMHIHHDINDFNIEQIKNLYKLYTKYEMNAIHSIQSPARHNNQYCRPVKGVEQRIYDCETIKDFKDARLSRYHTLNHKSYIKYGTIEFRGAQGTVEIDRILAWLELTHKMVEMAANKSEIKSLFSNRTNEEALEIMFEELQISDKTQKHYKKVQKFFSKLA